MKSLVCCKGLTLSQTYEKKWWGRIEDDGCNCLICEEKERKFALFLAFVFQGRKVN